MLFGSDATYSTVVYFLHGVYLKHPVAVHAMKYITSNGYFVNTLPACDLCAVNHTPTYGTLAELKGNLGWCLQNKLRLARRSVQGLARAIFQNTGCNFANFFVFLKMFRWISHKRGLSVLSRLRHHRYTTTGHSYPSQLHSSLRVWILKFFPFYFSLNVIFFIRHPSRQFCCN